MAWNEPGGDNKDPWSGKGGEQGTPDLDEVVKKMQDRLGGLFGGKGGNGGNRSGGGPVSGPAGTKGIIGLVVVGLVVLLGFKSFYTIAPAERGVVLRFGAYYEVTQPGLNFLIPVVDDVIKVNVDQISTFPSKETMLTKDENIVDIELTVQFKVQDPVDYLFQDRDPDKTIRDATETALRETIGKSKLDFILTEGRGSIASDIKRRIQELISFYKTGLEVTSVNTQPAKPPEAVKSAFDDAIKAREDKARQENQAEAYANDVVPRARGAASRVTAAAGAYKEQVIAEAEGETSRFLAVMKEYEKAPVVTRQRLYLETLEQVMGNTNKVIMDVKAGNSLMYLPIDKLIEARPDSLRSSSNPQATIKEPVENLLREDNRSRRVR
ncbi:FtsH protease activity modulator HflK [Sedimenticola selenatireducens]|uniref:Protein HflK n=1 Tax=Sedimenticola selenatireducens TaxID=191960 RepID=A0A2N6CVR6_9GAMM|nr:FtsH protease activity modulator HflK [Sedimenticola selenatireducens]PLX61281.1 MAG: FtsH protease activity modulator HflK [Sedimenticola selenatireducens]